MAAKDHHTAEAGIATGTAASTAGPERVRWPRLVASPQPRLRSLLSRGYAGFTEATVPRRLVLPATASVPLVVKLADSPYRPPAFVLGAHDASAVLEGTCAPRTWTSWPATPSTSPTSSAQAHLVRDFGRFTGMTPTQFQARLRSGREVKSVQDPVAASA